MYSMKEMIHLSGISRRTLYYYDQIGLLTPEVVDDNGYRIYSEQNLIRLQQILLLKSLGYTLSQVAELLSGQTLPQNGKEAWVHSLEQQIAWVDEEQEKLQRKRYLLKSMIHAVGTSGKVNAPELQQLLKALESKEVMNANKPQFNSDTYTPEELSILSSLPVMGSEDSRIQEYIELLEHIRLYMSEPPESDTVQYLAKRLWNWLLLLFQGNTQLLEKYWANLAPKQEEDSPVYGHDKELVAYVNRMMDVFLKRMGAEEQ
ncbi:MerR family transcriptional regulator [Paenibacillus agilis]|uniref:MerR family transcriptional regulator n=1 Tax=Paenibacillus agilis TaxID=3020863 RepID=A0A559IVN6_9BACL|nr:MerR family transcriptional regulator [Paenibacillus agilis]TVX91663.1 MerR family transcriptional regulator [Paenibacillus agilis]